MCVCVCVCVCDILFFISLYGRKRNNVQTTNTVHDQEIYEKKASTGAGTGAGTPPLVP